MHVNSHRTETNTPIMTHLWLRFLAITRKYLFIQIYKTQSRERDPKNPPRSPFTTRYWPDFDWLPFASLRANHIAQRQELLLHHQPLLSDWDRGQLSDWSNILKHVKSNPDN